MTNETLHYVIRNRLNYSIFASAVYSAVQVIDSTQNNKFVRINGSMWSPQIGGGLCLCEMGNDEIIFMYLFHLWLFMVFGIESKFVFVFCWKRNKSRIHTWAFFCDWCGMGVPQPPTYTYFPILVEKSSPSLQSFAHSYPKWCFHSFHCVLKATGTLPQESRIPHTPIGSMSFFSSVRSLHSFIRNSILFLWYS